MFAVKVINTASNSEQELATDRIIVPKGSTIEVVLNREDIAEFKVDGSDLQIITVDGYSLYLEDFFQEDLRDSNSLVLKDMNGAPWFVQYEQMAEGYVVTDVVGLEDLPETAAGPAVLGAAAAGSSTATAAAVGAGVAGAGAVATADNGSGVVEGPAQAPSQASVSANGRSVSGLAESNATVVASDQNGVEIGRATVQDDGQFVIEFDEALADGSVITLITVRPDGEISELSLEVLAEVLTILPLRVFNISLASASLTTSDDTVYVQTLDTEATLRGTATPNQLVTVALEGIELGTVTADANGSWSVTVPVVLSSGQELVFDVTVLDQSITTRSVLIRESLNETSSLDLVTSGVDTDETVSLLLQGVIEDGATLSNLYVVNPAQNFEVDISTIVITDQNTFSVAVVGLTGLIDGETTVTMVVERANGLLGFGRDSEFLDVTLPSAEDNQIRFDDIEINASEVGAVSLSGQFSSDASIESIVIRDGIGSKLEISKQQTILYIDNTFDVPNISLDALQDGILTVELTVVDAAGNARVVSSSAILDTIAPRAENQSFMFAAEAQSSSEVLELVGQLESGLALFELELIDAAGQSQVFDVSAVAVDESGNFMIVLPADADRAAGELEAKLVVVDGTGNSVVLEANTEIVMLEESLAPSVIAATIMTDAIVLLETNEPTAESNAVFSGLEDASALLENENSELGFSSELAESTDSFGAAPSLIAVAGTPHSIDSNLSDVLVEEDTPLVI